MPVFLLSLDRRSGHFILGIKFCLYFERVFILDGMGEERLVLSPQEQKLIKCIRELWYGEMHISVHGGKPVRIEEIKKSILLTDK